LNRVFQLILANPKITRKEIAESLGISLSMTHKQIKSLKENNIIKRSGGKPDGYWEIIEPSTE
ncbi:MAG: winged helix-turn-helix transcriptional regulator, partial [Muribaculaceae bacterium]|nr:winged helix-turn-helix transcriptional regulator [Muribaculaceae bacterium]